VNFKRISKRTTIMQATTIDYSKNIVYVCFAKWSKVSTILTVVYIIILIFYLF